MVILVPMLRCLPATNRVRLTRACLGATSLHLRFLPLPLHTRCLGTETVWVEMGHVPFLALQRRIAFAPPGSASIDIEFTRDDVAPVGKKSQCMGVVICRNNGSLIVAVAAFDEPPAFVAL